MDQFAPEFAPSRRVGPAATGTQGHLPRAARSTRSFRSGKTLTRISFGFIAVSVDLAAILSAALVADVGYNAIMHRWVEICSANLQLGLFAAILFVVSNAARHGYSVTSFLDVSSHAQRTLNHWTFAFLAAATFGFLARVIDDSSRGAFIVFCFSGLMLLYAGRAALTLFVRRHARNDGVLADRIMIVGTKREVQNFTQRHQFSNLGMTVLETLTLGDSKATLAADLAEATDTARVLIPDNIFIVVPWTRSDMIEAYASAFMRVPSALHLVADPNSALNRFAQTRMDRNGSISSLRLGGYAMSNWGMVWKRAFDFCAAGIALLLLSPLFALVALAIKLEDGGPVMFVQSRHGFNKMPFRIFKFRSMRAMEDGPAVKQATTNDPRVTRVGRILRKFNIDELPQLLNVLHGDMSLVGPRPHALVHDHQFEPAVELYARRHNVKPGITGWAQVNGLRGETDTSEKISKRVQYDLYYIDNWSFVLDIWIIFLTVFSKRAYLNAA